VWEKKKDAGKLPAIRKYNFPYDWVSAVVQEYGVFDENASRASFIETGILKTSTITFAIFF
jgi:hypothetical protein